MHGRFSPCNPVPGLTLKYPSHPSFGHSRPINPVSSVGMVTLILSPSCSRWLPINLPPLHCKPHKPTSYHLVASVPIQYSQAVCVFHIQKRYTSGSQILRDRHFL